MICSFNVYKNIPEAGINLEEQQKLSQEYQDYQKKFENIKDEYKKDHPDEVIIIK